MQKLKIELNNGTAPFEYVVLKHPISKFIIVDSLDNLTEIANQVRDFISTIKDGEKTTIRVKIFKENGEVFFSGSSINGGSIPGLIIN